MGKYKFGKRFLAPYLMNMLLGTIQIREFSFVISVTVCRLFGRYLFMIYWFWDNRTTVFQSQMVYGVEYRWKYFCVSLNMKVFCEGLRRNIDLCVVCWKAKPCNTTTPFPTLRDSQFFIHLHDMDSDNRQVYVHRTVCCVNPVFCSIWRWSKNISILEYRYVQPAVHETLYNISTEEYSSTKDAITKAWILIWINIGNVLWFHKQLTTPWNTKTEHIFNPHTFWRQNMKL
jgi:hypothetical protein